MKAQIITILFVLMAHTSFAQFSTIRRNVETKEVLLHVDYKKTVVPKNIKEDIKKEVVKADSVSKTNDVTIALPIKRKGHITSNYGMRLHPIDNVYKFHSGIDLRARKDTIYSVFSGVVSDSGYSKGLGYFVKIKFKEYSFVYGHLSEYYVLKGDKISTGVPIGLSGNTGKSTAEHLHFTIKRGDVYLQTNVHH